VPITVIATFQAVDGQRDELLAAVLRAVPDVLREDGCLAYAPHTVGKDRVLLVESWESPEALRVHGESPALLALREATGPLLAAPADVVLARPVDVPA
jgi:quinol monooxygenase YgiN